MIEPKVPPSAEVADYEHVMSVYEKARGELRTKFEECPECSSTSVHHLWCPRWKEGRNTT